MKKKPAIAIPVVVLKTKTGYNAFSPAVDGCVVTAKTVDAALKHMRDAFEFHFEGEALMKSRNRKAHDVLKDSFADYGADAVYASILIPT